jgi:hypothetical protein
MVLQNRNKEKEIFAYKINPYPDLACETLLRQKE